MNNYPWIKLHREAVGKLLTFRDNQSELISILHEMREAGLKVTPVHDQNPKGTKIPLAEIDPFTFLATFNRGLTDENRGALWAFLKDRWELASEIPKSFIGIPVANNMKSWWIPYSYQRDAEHVPSLWELAEQAYASSPEDLDEKLYEKCLSFHGIGLAYLTMGLYWVNPEQYLSLDAVNLGYLDEKYGITSKPKTYQGYLKLLDEFRSKVNKSIPELSANAYEWTWEEDEDGDGEVVEVPKRHWVISPGAKAYLWQEFQEQSAAAVGWDTMGDLKQYETKEDIRLKLVELKGQDGSHMNDTHALWEFANEISVGDTIYAKQGRSRVLGYGVVTQAYSFEPEREEFQHVIGVDWQDTRETELIEGSRVPMKTLTNIDNYRKCRDILESFYSDQSVKPVVPKKESYTRQDALADLLMSEAQFDNILAQLKRKKNIILQGPPGVGKTFVARRIAYAMMGEKNEARAPMIQFHQSYAYEDFIQGYRPDGKGGFELKDGTFHELCKEASEDSDRDYFLIIDEINRGNLSKIFGELMMLIEHDKRGSEFGLQLTYSSDNFHVPPNIHLIGTMNTADRSLSMVDYALRRRFSFITLQPEFGDKFAQLHAQAKTDAALTGKIQSRLTALNETILDDKHNLGKGYRIGHSFFCPNNGTTPDEEWYQNVIDFEIAPLLLEYWMDDEEKAQTQIDLLTE